MFRYSKKIQNKLGIKLNDYKIAHAINKKTIKLTKYLSFTDNFNKEEDKAVLKNDLEKDLGELKLDTNLESFLECAYDYLSEDDTNEDGLKLDIYSPFYDYFLKTGLNNKAFEVRVIDAIPVKDSGKIDYPALQQMLNK